MTVHRALAVNALFLGAIGLLAVGASGVIAGVERATLGDRFVAGDLPGRTYDAARCRELREYAPPSASCLDAAAMHHSDEVVFYRIAAGVVGLAAFGLWWAVRRRVRVTALPACLVPALAVTAFGLAAVVTATQAANALVEGGVHAGAGQWLSATVVAAAVTAAFSPALLRSLRPLEA
jgi:hypothetical protein